MIGSKSKEAVIRFISEMAVVTSTNVCVLATICFLTLGAANAHTHVKVLSSTCMIQLDTFASWLKCPSDDTIRERSIQGSMEQVFCCGPLRKRYCCSLSEKMSEDPRFDPQSYQQDLSFEDKYDIYVDSNNDDLTVEQGGVGFWKYLLAFSLTLSFTAISFYFFGAAIWMVITSILWCLGCKRSPKVDPCESYETRGASKKQSNLERGQLIQVVPRQTYNTIRAPSGVDLYTQAPPKYAYDGNNV